MTAKVDAECESVKGMRKDRDTFTAVHHESAIVFLTLGKRGHAICSTVGVVALVGFKA